MDHQPVELHQLMHEVYSQAKVLSDAKSITLCLGAIEPVVIQGDYERLRRLLLNLIDNGIKYTPNGGQVTLSLRRRDEWVLLDIMDTGIGLSAVEGEQIFQRFYRTDSARNQGASGSGLGLCIAHSIANAHGGAIDLDSTPGQGSTFTVRLPWHTSS
jgi:signal transduction histidine kinase